MPTPEAIRRAPRVDVLGVDVSAINMDDALEVIDGWITSGERQYVCVTGVHGVMESQRDPLVWLSRFHGQRRTTRVYGPDLMLALCERSIATGYRHFFYGGSDRVAEKLVQRLERRFPGLAIAGVHSPPYRSLTSGEDDEIVRHINGTKPDIVWVGLGTPKQEHWMAQHVQRLTASALIGVGAAFDFHAGVKAQAPRWMQRSGLEWLFRMASEPRRLGRRYLVNNPTFVWQTLRQLSRSAPSTAVRVPPRPASEPESDQRRA
jgi:N-acetylglucosaminyldiphosphoundecaprenol N-acetyl-beta-D-mannosaminyltransferase